MIPSLFIFYLVSIFCIATKSPVVTVNVSSKAPAYLQKRLQELLNQTSSNAPLLHLAVGFQGNLRTQRNGYLITVDSAAKIVRVQANSALSLSYGAYDVLRRLGYGFLHPMHPFPPKNLSAKAVELSKSDEIWEISPHFDFRGSHVHAEHPNELCNVLNGFDASGGIDKEGWETLLSEVDAYLEWLVANRQNAFEWSLLSAKYFAEFDQSEKRLKRLSTIVDMAKSKALEYVLIDATFSQTQEHGWRLWRKSHVREEDDWTEVKSRLDWLLSAGFDGINSELGKSEMQHEDNTTRLLALLNRTAEYLASKGKMYSLESHISTGQTIANLPDPTNPSRPINFNWATYYLNETIISRPHTVQIFSLNDPAYTYGATNFSDSVKFMELMLRANRPVVYYPETNYWCNFDVSVPLFLAPIYSRSRLADLSIIKQASAGAPRGLHGQVLFESSWQWGSYLQNIVSMSSQWSEFDLEHAFRFVLSPLGSANNVSVLAKELADLAELQHELLINGGGNKNLEMASGIAYLQGFDSSADLFQILKERGIANVTTQPDRLSLANLTLGSRIPDLYLDIEPLLSRMSKEFTNASERISEAIQAFQASNSHMKAVLMDISTSAKVMGLRATQIKAVYGFAARCGFGNETQFCRDLQHDSENAIEIAQKLVHSQERRYGLFAEGSKRLWAWGDEVNPSAYGFGAHWPVHVLHYWRRDHAIAFDGQIHPCFANIRDLADIYFGDGVSNQAQTLFEWIARMFGKDDNLTACLAPKLEPWVDSIPK